MCHGLCLTVDRRSGTPCLTALGRKSVRHGVPDLRRRVPLLACPAVLLRPDPQALLGKPGTMPRMVRGTRHGGQRRRRRQVHNSTRVSTSAAKATVAAPPSQRSTYCQLAPAR